jgi:hypothetical protein
MAPYFVPVIAKYVRRFKMYQKPLDKVDSFVA